MGQILYFKYLKAFHTKTPLPTDLSFSPQEGLLGVDPERRARIPNLTSLSSPTKSAGGLRCDLLQIVEGIVHAIAVTGEEDKVTRF